MISKQHVKLAWWACLGLVVARLLVSLQLTLYAPPLLQHQTTTTTPLKVVSMSLYHEGDDDNPSSRRRYTLGALVNANLLPVYYPGWELWIYHDSSIDESILQQLKQSENVKLLSMNRSYIANPMEWRFVSSPAWPTLRTSGSEKPCSCW